MRLVGTAQYINNLGINFSYGITEFAIHSGALNNPLDIYINGSLEGTIQGKSAGRDYNLVITIKAESGEYINNMELMGSNDGFIYDNLSYSNSAVPEPSSLILLGLIIPLFSFMKK